VILAPATTEVACATAGMCELGPNQPTDPSQATPGLGRCGARWRTRPTHAGVLEYTTYVHVSRGEVAREGALREVHGDAA